MNQLLTQLGLFGLSFVEQFAESDMVFQGFLAFLDPPKDSAKDALRVLAQKSVQVKVMTGDTLAVAVKVCRDVGIPTEHVVTGPELLLMEREEFNATVLQATILAKLTPTQKLDVIQVVKVPLPIQGKFHWFNSCPNQALRCS